METLDPARLQAILDLLVTSGVEEFEGYGFHVRFSASMFTPDKEVQTPDQVLDIPGANPPAHIWEEPKLWPGGKPPSFPSK